MVYVVRETVDYDYMPYVPVGVTAMNFTDVGKKASAIIVKDDTDLAKESSNRHVDFIEKLDEVSESGLGQNFAGSKTNAVRLLEVSKTSLSVFDTSYGVNDDAGLANLSNY